MPSCPRCEEFRKGLSIDKPRDYLEFARRLLALVDEGVLALNQSTCPLQELFNSQWPADLVEHNFECKLCGRTFQLFADTYHGHAGWDLTGPPTREQTLEPTVSS